MIGTEGKLGKRGQGKRRVVGIPSKRTIAIALGCVAAGAALAPAGVAGAGTLLSVVIGNDSSHPVPTKAIGTTKVDGTVTVVNGSDKPVPVTQANGTPYQTTINMSVPDDRLGADTAVTVPAGKDLVIEHISIHSVSNKRPYWFWVEATDPTSSAVLGAQYLPITETPAADGVGRDHADAATDTSLRVPDQYRVAVRFDDVASDATAFVSVIGRLVDEQPIAG